MYNTVCVNLNGFPPHPPPPPSPPIPTPPCYCQFGCVDLLFWTKSKKNMTKALSKSRNVTLAIKKLISVRWPLCICPAYILTLLQVSNHYLEIIEKVAETRPLLCHVYKVIFLNKSRICNSSNVNSISSVTFMHMPCLSYYSTSFKLLPWNQ